MTTMDPAFSPMLAYSKAVKDVSELGDPTLWAAERKFDGWRLICHRKDFGVETWGGRNGGNYSKQLPYLDMSLMRALPVDTVVDGEIIAPAGFGGVQTIMRRATPHVPSGNWPPLTLWVFDILRVEGRDCRSLPWWQRRQLVEQVQLENHMRITEILDTTQGSYEKLVAEGAEGMILKYKQARYVNARTNLVRKMKHELTAEARVLGFKPGENSLTGLVGAIEFELLDSGVQSRCSGFDMDLREAMTADPDAYMDRIFELKFNPGVGEDGKPRHPNFLRWREDREPAPAVPGKRSRPITPKITTTESRPRMRNYKQMNDDKLLRTQAELEGRYGEGFQKAKDPEAELAIVNKLVKERKQKAPAA